MRRYLFYVEGVGREVWSDPAFSQSEAHKQVWTWLSPEDQDRTACLDCIDEEAADLWPPIEMREQESVGLVS
jgi:uncharacterized protein YdeI (YjbR/CyaY-like superfamily)